jgi:hypothetical protein
MTDGRELLRRARDAGLRVAPKPGGKIDIRGPKHAEPVARLLLAHKPAVIAALAADWRARYCEALAHWGAFRAPDAAQLAWGEIESRWHLLHGQRWPTWECAGCGAPIGGLPAFDLPDGNRVHFDAAHGLDCLLAFGERWRGDARAGLRALGLDPPADNEPQ